jgi:hypothetical protein
VGDEDARLEELRAEARHARQRLDLYRARMHGSRPTSVTRLRELEHAARQAQERLDFALREAGERPGE